jgi:iron-sulfur cluster insertion protein
MPVVVTDSASKRFDDLCAQQLGYPRIEITAGGCNGFEKRFSWTTDLQEDDVLVPHAHGHVIIDTVSLSMLEHAVVDYKTDLSGCYFTIDIPEAASTCGCGTSFSL